MNTAADLRVMSNHNLVTTLEIVARGNRPEDGENLDLIKTELLRRLGVR